MSKVSDIIKELQFIKDTMGDIEVVPGEIQAGCDHIDITVADYNDMKIALIHT